MVDLPFARKVVAVAGIALPLWASLWTGPAIAQDGGAAIPWKPGLTFSRTAVDDDVRSVLRAMLAAEGLSAVFTPGAYPSVSFNFRDMPIEAAFTQVTQSNGLRASYSPAARTVTIGLASAATTARRFITL